MRKIIVLIGVIMGTAVILTALITTLQAAPTDSITYDTSDLIYDPSQQSTPFDQTFEYVAASRPYNCATPPLFICIDPPQATQVYSSTIMGTVLNSMEEIEDYAGYAITPTLAPTLTRAEGFKLDFTLNVREETHSNDNRAGFVVILLADDMQGIEVSFWDDEIWVQELDEMDEFVHAEGISYTTTTWVDYELAIINDTYTLSADNTEILSGTVRDYTSWEPPSFGGFTAPDPYETPNLIFFGDNSSRGRSQTWIQDITIHYNKEKVEYNIYLPTIIK